MARQEAALANRWELADVLGNGKLGPGRVMEELETETKRFEKLREALPRIEGPGVEEALNEYSAVSQLRARVNSYAQMLFSQDTGNQDSKVLVDKASDLWAETDNRMLFFKLWWIRLSDEMAAGLKPRESDYSYFLETLRRLKPHILEERVEQAINLKNATGNWQWVHHYEQLTSAFTFSVSLHRTRTGGGEKPPNLVASEVTKLFSSPDARTRRAAYVAYLGKFRENAGILGDIYRTIVRDWRNEYLKLRGYASPIAVRNMENEVSDLTVSKLLASCKKNVGVFQEFFTLKAKLLGLKRMSRYHMYAPLLRREKKVSFEEGLRQVMDAFESFDPRLASLARKVFESRHVDVYPAVGKRSGAYCMSVTPELIPYILLNFSGSRRDIYTIAHESGHAIHSQLASGHSILTFQPTLVLAETASVFGEMVLFDKMMGEQRDPEIKKSVLLEKISSMYATIGRQSHFVLFEIEAHDAVDGGTKVDGLSSLYLSNLKGQFGTRMDVPEEFSWEWTAIPHIYHTPFYCYAYAFGNLLSLALYQLYKKEGREFVPRYLRLLSHGGSASPKEILGEVGVDAEKEAFWDSGFAVIGQMVGELRRL